MACYETTILLNVYENGIFFFAILFLGEKSKWFWPKHVTWAELAQNSKHIFLEFMLSGRQTVVLRSNLISPSKMALKELSNALFRGTIALLVPELYADLKKKMLKMVKFDLW